MSKLLISLYTGEIFAILFIVSPIVFKAFEKKNVAGRIYGQILWRFYKIAFIELGLVFLLNISFYTFLLLTGLLLNVYLSYYMKSLKQSIGDIDNMDFNHPLRVKFRMLFKISSGVLVINMLLATFFLI